MLRSGWRRDRHVAGACIL